MATAESDPPQIDPENHSFPPDIIARIHEMAASGHYPIGGLGARRKLPTFDDLVFLTASVSRYPLERATAYAATRQQRSAPGTPAGPSNCRSRSQSPA